MIAKRCCPFCGSVKIKATTKSRHAYPQNITRYQMLCNSCFARGPLCATPEQAELKWNLQVAPDKPTFEIAGRAWIILDDDGLEARLEVLDGTHLQIEHSPVDLYVKIPLDKRDTTK